MSLHGLKLHLSGSRNKCEAATLAKILDCITSSLGLMGAKNEPAVKLAIQRLAAVTMSDTHENLSAARDLEEEQDDLLSATHRRKLHKSPKLRE